MSTIRIPVTTRVVSGKKVKTVRSQGKIPGVLYGHGITPTNLTIEYIPFEKAYHQAGTSTLVDLVLDDKQPVKALIQDIQMDPLTDRVLHVDFHQVRMDEKLHAEIPLKFVGEAPAVKEFSAIFVKPISALKVECLPQDLVHEIEADISGLKNFNDAIHISDIKLPPGLTVLHAPEETVALVQEPRSEKELEALEEKPVAAMPVEPEKVGKEKTEDEPVVEIEKEK